MYRLFMAVRYLRAHKIIYFSIVGVALGIMTMVVVTSLMGGFSRDMRARIRGMQTHIVVNSADKNLWIADYDALCAEIGKVPHVIGCAPRIEYEAWMGRSGAYRDVHIVGIDPERERTVSDVEAYFRKGSKRTFDFDDAAGFPLNHSGIVVGAELRGGRQVGLLTARHETTPVLCVKDFETVGHFRSGMAEYDSSYLFMHLSAAQEFLRVGGEEGRKPRVNVLAVSVDNYELHGRAARDAIVAALHARRPCMDPSEHGPGMFGGGYRCGLYRTMTWEQSKRILLQAVDVEKGMQFILLFLIVLVAGFNIIAIYTLVVRSKTRDIGILRALGATGGGVTSIFLMSGGLCGLLGSIFGIILGLLLAWNLNGIADFIRVVSREMNRMPRSACWVAIFFLTTAGVAVLCNWGALYKHRVRHPWVRMILAGTALAGAAYFSAAWLPGYRPFDHFDADLPSQGRWTLVLSGVALWALFCMAWRLLDRYRLRPGWIFFGAAATLFLSALLLAIVGAFAIAVAILALGPDVGWPGLELFPRQIYYLDRIPVFVDSSTLATIVAITLLVSLVFSIYPALRAAAANPIEAIRDE